MEANNYDDWRHETSEMDMEWQRRHDQFYNIGYREGLMAGKEAAAQEGFNVSFRESVRLGYNWGLVRGVTGVLDSLPDGLKERLVDTKEIQNTFQHLHKSVRALSTAEVLKIFHDCLTCKAEEKCESTKSSSCVADLLDHNSDRSRFEDYQQELHSLILECGLKLHIDTNQ